MDEKEIALAMKRLKKIDEEARKRLLQEKEKEISLKKKKDFCLKKDMGLSLKKDIGLSLFKDNPVKMGSVIGKTGETSISAPKIKMYCSVITTNGTQCSKYQVDGCNKMCKQHFENSKKDVVMKENKTGTKKAVKSEDPKPQTSTMDIEKEEKLKPKKKEAIPAAIKTLVWNKYIGEKVAEAKCMCCRVTTISMRHHHCSHVLSEKYGGSVTVDNLRPTCANCNLSMGTMSMADFISKYGLHK
jgi:5-methylcytosine-specific restriction endonuclease McrA